MKFLIFTTIFILFSCGSDLSNLSPRSQVGVKALNKQNLSGSQETMAQQICFSFRSKNVNYRNALIGNTFKFDIEKSVCDPRDCPDSNPACLDDKDRDFILDTELISISNSNPLEFDPLTATNESFYHQVQTHEFGELKEICEKLLKGEEATNTYQTDSGKKQILFYTENNQGFTGFSSIFFRDDEESSYKEIRLKVNLDEKKYGADKFGLIEEIIEDEECPQESLRSQKTFSQTYKP